MDVRSLISVLNAVTKPSMSRDKHADTVFIRKHSLCKNPLTGGYFNNSSVVKSDNVVKLASTGAGQTRWSL